MKLTVDSELVLKAAAQSATANKTLRTLFPDLFPCFVAGDILQHKGAPRNSKCLLLSTNKDDTRRLVDQLDVFTGPFYKDNVLLQMIGLPFYKGVAGFSHCDNAWLANTYTKIIAL